MMNSSRKIQLGFTLIEIAIVLVIVTILLGYSVAMFSVQQELKRYRQAESEMESVIEHLIAFAQVNGRLPCPDTSAGAGTINGLEDAVVDIVTLLIDDCEAFFGFLPARTLGLSGKFNDQGVLIDPWGSGYGYAVSAADAGDGIPDLVSPNGIRIEGIAAVQPDLFICDDSDTLGNHLNCAAVSGGTEVVGANGAVAAVIISLGKDFEIPATSNIQAENLDDFHNGTNDKVYIFSPRRDDYDDIVKWLPTNLLFSKMIEADQLP
jgi:prepilin-type N-terminal cleavage/methylation domain-containing protein